MSKILVIEDDINVCDNIVELLSIHDFEVEYANNGKIGIEKALSINPDLILCDIMMPELDGYGVLEELKKHPDTFYTPFIFLTAKNSSHDRRQGMLLGADDYISKPYKNDDIIGAVRSKLEKYSKFKSNRDDRIEELRRHIAQALPHEFRTPLNGIFGFSQLLKSDYNSLTDDDRLMMIDQIYDSSKRLNHLISNFLYYAKLFWEKPIDFDKINLLNMADQATIFECAEKCAYMYDRRCDLTNEIASANFMLDKQILAKIIEEIVDNAFKFSEIGQQVSITGRIVDRKYYLTVKNAGRGMSTMQISQIGGFNQFDRPEFEQQGIGLGLAIVKKLCDTYNLELDIECIESVEINFILKLPVYYHSAG